MYVLEHWSNGAWVSLGTFVTKAEARTRGWELRLQAMRVRELSAVAP